MKNLFFFAQKKTLYQRSKKRKTVPFTAPTEDEQRAVLAECVELVQKEVTESRAKKRAKSAEILLELKQIADRLHALTQVSIEPDLSKPTAEKVEQDFKAAFVIKEVPFATQQRNQTVFYPYPSRMTAEEQAQQEKFASKDKSIIDLFKKQTDDRNSAMKTIYHCCRSSDNVAATSEQQEEFDRLMKVAERSLNRLQLAMNVGIQQHLQLYD